MQYVSHKFLLEGGEIFRSFLKYLRLPSCLPALTRPTVTMILSLTRNYALYFHDMQSIKCIKVRVSNDFHNPFECEQSQTPSPREMVTFPLFNEMEITANSLRDILHTYVHCAHMYSLEQGNANQKEIITDGVVQQVQYLRPN